jgi:hypothetical protein
MKRRIAITVEAERTLLVTSRSPVQYLRCEDCEATVPVASASHASIVEGVSVRTIYRWIEDGRVHFLQRNLDGDVCLRSLHLAIGRT